MNGMTDIDEEDAYSDDDLDALAPDEFEELQRHALLSAQQKPLHIGIGQQHGSSLYNLSQGPNLSAKNESPYTLRAASKRAQGLNSSLQPSSDYGDYDFEDEVLDGGGSDNKVKAPVAQFDTHGVSRTTDQAKHREYWRQQRYGAPIQPEQLPNKNDSQKLQALGVPQASAVMDRGHHNNDKDQDMLDVPEVEENGHIQPTLSADAEDSLHSKVAEVNNPLNSSCS